MDIGFWLKPCACSLQIWEKVVLLVVKETFLECEGQFLKCSAITVV